MGDELLASIMRRFAVRPPIERIVRTDIAATALNRSKLTGLSRVAVLACGHTTITANRDRAACHACHRLILEGEDYDAFRRSR